MTYRGQVKNGQIVLEAGAALGEGTLVEVIPLGHNGSAPRGSSVAILASQARWVGAEDEPDRILEELRREKWTEVESQRAAEHDLPDHEA
jgi:hypothetical protein